MSFQSTPTKSGVYRIKVFNENLYVESIPQGESTAYTPWMRLAGPTSNKKQEWVLTQSANDPSQWTIASAVDNAGLVYKKTRDTYHGHGYPYPLGQSLQWKISEYYGQYSKIITPFDGNEVFDSEYRAQGDDAVHFWHQLSQAQGPYQCFVFESVPDEIDLKLDVVFLQDATGSQQPYIDSARDNITQICKMLKDNSNFQHDDDLRFRLIAFRDHPPEDDSFIVKPEDFTSDASILQGQLKQLTAEGGGDGPEAQCDALDAALNSAWRDDAAKVVVLITDSPPHGLEDSGDGFPNGCPLQNDPCRTVDLFVDNDITLNVIACEPTLSSYANALDFYSGLVQKTNGKLLPLGNASAEPLKNAVAGIVAYSRGCAQISAKLSDKISGQPNRSARDIAVDLHRELAAQGVRLHQASSVKEVYVSSEQGDKNVQIWAEAKSLKEGKSSIQKVSGQRLKDEHSGGGTFDVAFKQEPVTLENVHAIVTKAMKKSARRT